MEIVDTSFNYIYGNCRDFFLTYLLLESSTYIDIWTQELTLLPYD